MKVTTASVGKTHPQQRAEGPPRACPAPHPGQGGVDDPCTGSVQGVRMVDLVQEGSRSRRRLPIGPSKDRSGVNRLLPSLV